MTSYKPGFYEKPAPDDFSTVQTTCSQGTTVAWQCHNGAVIDSTVTPTVVDEDETKPSFRSRDRVSPQRNLRQFWVAPVALLSASLLASGCSSTASSAGEKSSLPAVSSTAVGDATTAPASTGTPMATPGSTSGSAGSSPAASSTSHVFTTPSTSASSTAAVGRCDTKHLAITDDGGQGAGGTFLGRFTFRNITSTPCYLAGSPGFLRLGVNGQPVPTNVVRQKSSAATVVLQPKGRAYARYSYLESGVAPCPSAAKAARVTPPDATAFIVVTSNIDPCGDMKGTVDVKAVVATPAELNN